MRALRIVAAGDVHWSAHAAHVLGAVPLAFLSVLHWRGERRDAGWWWMGAAFGVSFVADFLPWHLASQVYPITQAALFAAVLVPSRPWAEKVIALILVAAVVSVMAREGQGLDVLLRVIAWLSVSGLAYTFLARGPLRDALTFGFFAMTVAWLVYVMVPGWTSWLTLQGARVVTTGWWAYAAVRRE